MDRTRSQQVSKTECSWILPLGASTETVPFHLERALLCHFWGHRLPRSNTPLRISSSVQLSPTISALHLAFQYAEAVRGQSSVERKVRWFLAVSQRNGGTDGCTYDP